MLARPDVPDIAARSRPGRPGGWRTLEPPEECRSALHRHAFRAAHDLAGHPLFGLEALIGVAQEAAKRYGDLYMDAGNVAVTDKWGDIPVPDMPITRVIERIESAGAWIVMKHVEENPAYAAVLRDWADFVREVAGPDEAPNLLKPEMLVFITSPRRLTPFHFDAEVNFLVQIHGSKDLWVCDPHDRTITTEAEIEEYYGRSITAGNFKPHAEASATHFRLEPGDAVHIPSHAGHWVRNHDDISVSLSLNFELPRRRHANVYQANYYLRRLGLRPSPPGRSAMVDGAKSLMIGPARAAAVRGVRTARRLSALVRR